MKQNLNILRYPADQVKAIKSVEKANKLIISDTFLQEQFLKYAYCRPPSRPLQIIRLSDVLKFKS